MEFKRERQYNWEDPMIGASKGRTLSGMMYMKEIMNGEVPPPPIAITLGMGIVSCEDGKAVFSLTPSEYHYNPIGSVHGGVFATVLDSAMGCAVHTTLSAGTMYTTLELKVNFVRPLTATTGQVLCEGTVISAGKRVALAEGKIVDERGRLYAHATCTCLIFKLDE